MSDIAQMVNYESFYEEEQDLLMYVLRIFGEFAKSAKMAEINTTNGIIPICIKIISNPAKYKKEVKMWALIIINRGCSIQQAAINEKTLEAALSTSPPNFIAFILAATDPEDLDYTLHSKYIWEMMELFAKK